MIAGGGGDAVAGDDAGGDCIADAATGAPGVPALS
jgi:hypothetical protein